ncbi:MAG TPA: PAS domain-containing protein [Ideonella sp.]|uniref:PAS domain-containing protein n=1 Tax=Ideonella sp. TaxID=1929293 RepID=UPI002E3486F9|nr:PAS domain-containing protein [Ideonella sp.]HEX5686445.1 PAS domain-containing protein [Ideonella sp.]
MIEVPSATEPDAQALLCAAGRLGRIWQEPATGAEGWDDATFRMLGLDPAHGVPVGGLFSRLHPQDAKRVQGAWPGPIPSLSHIASPATVRCRILRPDGVVRHLQLLDATPATEEAPSTLLRWTLVIDDTDAVDAYREQWDIESVTGRALTMAGISLWDIDLAAQRVFYSQQGFRILGVDRQPQGVRLAEVRAAIHPEDRVLIEQAAEEAIRTDRPVDAVARYRDAAGEYKHLLTRRYRVCDDHGRTVALRGMSLDVSELVRERERSLSLLERMQMVAETIGVGFWWRDLDAGIFEWDEQMYRMHHRQPAEGPPSLDEWISRHVHPADRGWMAARQEVHHHQWTPASDVTFRTLAPDGSERWIQSWTRRLMRHGHRVSLGIHVDITERRRAEQRAELERQRDQFAIEAAGIGVWERRASDGMPVYWSPTMYRLRGLDVDDPRPLQDIVDSTMKPEVDAEAVRRLQHCVATGERFAFEFEVTWPDGTVRWLSSNGRAVRDAQGHAVVVAGVNVDITERRRMEQLARERDRAQQASAAKSELMARVSHELRTPMNAVLGFADLMAHDVALPAAQAERLARIRSAGTHLLGLIDDLLELSRADQGGRAMDVQAVSLAEVLQDALPWVATLAAQSGVQVVADGVASDAAVLADRRRLGQVLINLLTNGIKYNQPGGRVWLDLRPTQLSGQPAWELTVHDDGRGLSPEQLQRLFEPFNRLGAEREGIPGTGIGLSIVQQLVAGMGGELLVDSRLGEGSRFAVRLAAAVTQALPVAAIAAAPDEAPSAARAATTSAPSDAAPTLRVLYIEDNPVNEMLVREMLGLRPGIVLDSAPDGGSGIRQALAGAPDLILLDLQLPDMNGIEVMKRLRHEPSLSSCRFVALSANAMPEDVSQALAAGFNEYWTKPLNLQQFLADMDALTKRLGRA